MGRFPKIIQIAPSSDELHQLQTEIRRTAIVAGWIQNCRVEFCVLNYIMLPLLVAFLKLSV